MKKYFQQKKSLGLDGFTGEFYQIQRKNYYLYFPNYPLKNEEYRRLWNTIKGLIRIKSTEGKERNKGASNYAFQTYMIAA